MNKYLLTVVLITLTAIELNAQGFYIKAGGGYAWQGFLKTQNIKGFEPFFSDYIGDASKVLDPAYASIQDLSNQTHINSRLTGMDSISKVSSPHNSYGTGGNISLTVGYNINPYVGFELGFSYLFGATNTAIETTDNLVLLGNNTTIITRTHAAGLSLMPAVIVYGAKPNAKVKPYARLGLNLPVFGSTFHTINVNSPTALLGTSNLQSELKVETKSTVSLGVSGAIGVQYSPVKFLSIWAEVNGTSLDVRGKTSTLTEYVIDATDIKTGTKTHCDRLVGGSSQQLPTVLEAGLIGVPGSKVDPTQKLSNYSRVIEYVDELNSSSNTEDFGKQRDATKSGTTGYVDETKNHQKVRLSAPFSNIGFNVGVTLHLSKKAFAKEEKK